MLDNGIQDSNTHFSPIHGLENRINVKRNIEYKMHLESRVRLCALHHYSTQDTTTSELKKMIASRMSNGDSEGGGDLRFELR